MAEMCLFVCVVGPGFDSTSPAIVRSRASQAARRDSQLAQKTESGPHIVQMSEVFQPPAGCVFLELI